MPGRYVASLRVVLRKMTKKNSIEAALKKRLQECINPEVELPFILANLTSQNGSPTCLSPLGDGRCYDGSGAGVFAEFLETYRRCSPAAG